MTFLNRQQYLASLPDSGVSLVIAGAGTGKTKTLVEKVKNVISAGIAKPEEILILTFSSKAAQEIKDRVKSGIGNGAEYINSGTFHSFCLNFLRNNERAFQSSYGFVHFPRVIDQEEKVKLLKDELQDSLDRFLGLPVDVAAGLIDGLERLDKRIFEKLERMGITEELQNIRARYKTLKISQGLIDFNDMMEYTIDILSNNESIRQDTISKYKYIFVDEFQDTSEDNFLLLWLLLPDANPNLFLVGDDWQSIYGFRGSKVEYIVKMKKYFPNSIIYKLNLNYRSRKEIVKFTNNFIKKNKYRTSKKLKSAMGRGGIILDFCIDTLEEEVKVISGILKSEKGKAQKDSNGVAVLYRNNWQGNYILNILLSEGIETDKLTFLTMHSSKGLEFDTVIIAGVSDKIIPDASADIEEERRLFYVALTRAKNALYIVHHRSADDELSIFARELGFKKREK